MYRGRFAPTPSGPLHLGSLVAAVGSYLDAHAHNGQWFVRIEDVDKPRAVPGAADTILRQLEDHGLTWHGEVIFQSDRDESYQDYINSLTSADCIYQCDCSRKAIRERGGIYDGYCRTRHRPATSACPARTSAWPAGSDAAGAGCARPRDRRSDLRRRGCS